MGTHRPPASRGTCGCALFRTSVCACTVTTLFSISRSMPTAKAEDRCRSEGIYRRVRCRPTIRVEPSVFVVGMPRCHKDNLGPAWTRRHAGERCAGWSWTGDACLLGLGSAQRPANSCRHILQDSVATFMTMSMHKCSRSVHTSMHMPAHAQTQSRAHANGHRCAQGRVGPMSVHTELHRMKRQRLHAGAWLGMETCRLVPPHLPETQ